MPYKRVVACNRGRMAIEEATVKVMNNVEILNDIARRVDEGAATEVGEVRLGTRV